MKITGKHIENWVARFFPDYKRKSGGRQLAINNPFDGDRNYHMYISTYEDEIEVSDPVKGRVKIKNFWVHDWRPQARDCNGSFINFVKRYRGLKRYEALSEVLGKSINFRDILSKKDEKEPEEEEREKIIQLPMSKSIKEASPYRKFAVNYLNKRMVSEERAIEIDIHYTPNEIIFPYYEFGLMVFWQLRSFLEKRFEFPNEEETGLKKTDYFYNFDGVTVGSDVVIVESIFNAESVQTNCLASGGAIIAGEQIKKLSYLEPNYTILGPDNDEAGKASLRHNYFLLRNRYKLAYCIPPNDFKDWNQLDQVRGKGTSFDYISNNTKKLSLTSVI